MATLVNRAKMYTSTTGTGSINLGGSAVPGFTTFAAAGVVNGNTVRYAIDDGANWEIGSGTYSTTGPTLSRGPTQSSNGNLAISLSGNAVVYATMTVADILQPANNLSEIANPTLARNRIGRGIIALSISNGVVSTDCSLGNYFTIAATSNFLLQLPTNLQAGAEYVWQITQDATGGRVLTLDNGFRNTTGSAPVLSTTPNAVDYLESWCMDGTHVDLKQFEVGYTQAAPSTQVFGSDSPFNVAIPASPTLDTNSAAIVTKLNSWAGPAGVATGTYNTTNDFDIPVYQASITDPLFTISTDTGTYPFGRQIQGTQIRIPDAAKAAGGSDGHLVVIQPNKDWVYEFWQVSAKPAGGGTLTASSGGRLRYYGDGIGLGQAIGSRTSAMMGLITPAEITTNKIPHAISIIVKSSDATNVWPASNNLSTGDPTNAPHAGTWFQYNMTPAAIAALTIPAWQKAILTAMSVYGAVVIDTGGSSWNFRWVDDASTASLGGGQPIKAWAASIGYTAVPSFVDIKTGIDWTKFQALDATYLKGLYATRLASKKLDPVATVSNNFGLTGGATADACLVDPAYPPYGADTTIRVGSGTAGNVCEVRVATPTVPSGKTLKGLVANVSAATTTNTLQIDIESGSSSIGTYTVAQSQTVGWWQVAATSVTGVTLSDLRIKLTIATSSAGFSNVGAAHIQAEYA